jgi:hypothetical protein
MPKGCSPCELARVLDAQVIIIGAGPAGLTLAIAPGAEAPVARSSNRKERPRAVLAAVLWRVRLAHRS